MALDDFRVRFGKVLMELVGTALFVMTIQLSGSTTSLVAPASIGLVLVVLVYSGGPISGGHFNPAISLAAFLRGTLQFQSLLLYWVFQFAGAFCGALLGALISGNVVYPSKGPEYYLLQAFLAELVFTALLTFAFVACTTNKKVEDNSYYGVAIGLVVFVGTATCAPISGAAFNPGVAVALSIVHGLSRIGYMLWIVIAEAVGGIAGALLYYLVAGDEAGNFGEEAQALLQQRRQEVEEAME